MCILLGFACVLLFLTWAGLLELTTRRRLYRFAQARRILKNAALWISLDYTLEQNVSERAKRLLGCALNLVESDELNYKIGQGLYR